MDLTPPQFPDDYLVSGYGHAAAVAAVELVALLRNGRRLPGFGVSAPEEDGYRLAVDALIAIVEKDWRELRASDADYLLAARAKRALEATPGRGGSESPT